MVKQDTVSQIFDQQGKNVLSVGNTNWKERVKKLTALEKSILKYKEEICEALNKDLRKSVPEAELSEVFVLLSELKYVKRRLRYWMRDEPVGAPLYLLGTKSTIRHESKGRVLIISPWNYPFLLAMSPLISAIAGGNTVVIKPSEISVNTSLVIDKVIRDVFRPDEVQVVLGGVEEATHLLSMPFNHIFFTGSTTVGKEIMKAAAKNLTSVTLELGGKSPAVVSKHSNLKKAVERICFSKFFNNGQICIAPDYVLVEEEIRESFLELMKEQIHQLFGKAEESPVYTRIISDRHFDRVKNLLDKSLEQGAELICGGEAKREDRFLSPTVVYSGEMDIELMTEEIFGPVLPVFSIENIDSAINYINANNKPLATYIFSKNKKEVNHFIKYTRSGGTAVNNGLIQIVNTELPFGGSNHSGIGKSKGHWGFMEFTNQRAVIKDGASLSIFDLVTYPFTPLRTKIIRLLTRWF